MDQDIALKIDPEKASIDNLLAMSFSKSTSTVYPIVVNIAQGAMAYDEIEAAKKTIHFVVFDKTEKDAGRALTILRYAEGWKGIQVFTNGIMAQSLWKVSEVLKCYLEACACNDWRAHCQEIIDDPYNNVLKKHHESIRSRRLSVDITYKKGIQPPKQGIKVARYLFPCTYVHANFHFKTDHPSTPEDQIQAWAIHQGCDWCPHFDPANYKEVGTDIRPVDAFD